MQQSVASALVAGMLVFFAFAGPVAAQSLAGSEGDVRRKPYFPAMMTGGCDRAYGNYVATGRHAAYASTPDGFDVEAFVCGTGAGASQKAAEAAALKSCEAGRKQFKVVTLGRCILYASK